MAHVTTFYSYKGGVGRTMLLANVGAWLAQRRKVALWDLDLEAPGLHRIPALRVADVRAGFLEWLRDHAVVNIVTDEARAALRALVRPAPSQPDLVVLPAHGDGVDLAALYHSIPWATLLAERPERGLALFRAALDVLREGRDHVLIDARTGITDLGGLVAAVLPDLTVLVGGYGHQNLAGLDQVRRGLQAAIDGRLPDDLRAGPLQVVHVVSPVPSDTPGAADRRRTWREVFPNVTPVEVPFDARLLFEERLLALEDGECPAGRAYREVAARVDDARRTVAADAATEAAPQTERGRAFEERVAKVLGLHGYVVSPGEGVDFVAELEIGLERQVLHVECRPSARPCGTDPLVRLRARLPTGVRGMVVARAFTRAARALDDDHPELRAVTLDELERRLFEPTPWLHRLMTRFESSQLALAWVEQHARVGEREVDVLDYARAWARGEGGRILALEGPFGSGRTALLHRLAYELAQRAAKDTTAPIPVVVSGGDDLGARLAAEVRGTGGRPSADAMLHLVATGRVIVLVDDAGDVVLPAPLEPTGSRALVVGGAPGAVRVALLPLSRPEIEAFLTRRGGGARGARAMARLDGEPAIAALASHPATLRELADLLLAEEAPAWTTCERIARERWLAAGGPLGALGTRAWALWRGADPGPPPPDCPFLGEDGRFLHPHLLDAALTRHLARVGHEGLAGARLSANAATLLAKDAGYAARAAAALVEGGIPGVAENLLLVAHAAGLEVDGARLDGAHLADVDLREARLPHARLGGADLSRAQLDGARLEGADLRGARLDEASLAGADLEAADLRGARANGAAFVAANLRRVRLDGAAFDGARFVRTRLHGATVDGAAFRGCDFTELQARNVDWSVATGGPT